MIQQFFMIEQEVTLLDGQYDFGLVALSLMIAIFASFMAFNVATQAATSTNKFRKYALLSAGSIASNRSPRPY